MNPENPQNSRENLKKELERTEDKIESLEKDLAKISENLKKVEKGAAELEELGLIISGLHDKAAELRAEDKSKGMPESDEEWEFWTKRMERMDRIYDTIIKLDEEYDAVYSKLDNDSRLHS